MTVEWEPFLLNRDTPAEGIDMIDYIRDRYGGDMARNFDKRVEGMAASGRAVGISFNRSRRVVNTLDGHRLVEFVKGRYADKAGILMVSIIPTATTHICQTL